jgi:hypothetical protein
VGFNVIGYSPIMIPLSPRDLDSRKPNLSGDRGKQEAHPVDLHRAGALTSSDLAGLFGVGRATVYRATTADAA